MNKPNLAEWMVRNRLCHPEGENAITAALFADVMTTREVLAACAAASPSRQEA